VQQYPAGVIKESIEPGIEASSEEEISNLSVSKK
jgi:hypothetical protein